MSTISNDILNRINGSTSSSGTSGTSSTTAQSGAEEASERFLKLLVAQMQNQDPLAPMDNAQVTSQMAQINTVTGISQLNDTVKSMTGTLAQAQMLQGASLVGRTVLVEGNQLTLMKAEGEETATAAAGFELASAADSVKIEVLSPGGALIDTIELGSLDAGQHGFSWVPDEGVNGEGATFRITARAGKTTVTATPLNVDYVDAVSTTPTGLTLHLRNAGTTDYATIKAVS